MKKHASLVKTLARIALVAGLWLGTPASAFAQAPSDIWISRSDLLALPTSGAAWNGLLSAANKSCAVPNLENQDDTANVCVMAKALVFARTGQSTYRQAVVSALTSIVNAPAYGGRALALGRELAAYVIAADLIDLKNYNTTLDVAFRVKLQTLLVTLTVEGPQNLIYCHEERPNNWGTHCGASRAAIAAYLGDTVALEATARVFKGWLGDRTAYAQFSYGDTSWQCDPGKPVGINPAGCTKSGYVIDGVLPDDQRRAGSFAWPAPQENYVYEALQGALAQAVILRRAGYDVFEWENRALLRAFTWLHAQNGYAAEGDDTWQPHVINYFYGSNFPAPSPSQPGKNVGWTDWTFQGRPAPVESARVAGLSFSPSSVTGGAASTGVVVLSSAAGAGGAVVELASGSSLVRVPSQVTVPSGATSVAFSVTTSTTSSTQQVPVTATLDGWVQTSLTVLQSASTSTARTVTAMADAYIRAGSYAGRNYGSGRDLETKDGSDPGYDRRILVKFDARGGGVASATLKLYVSGLPNGAPVTVCVFSTADSWTEKTVTWSNQPGYIALLGCRTVSATGWQTWDVTAFVKQEATGDGFASFLVADTMNANRLVRINSREHSNNRPLIEIK